MSFRNARLLLLGLFISQFFLTTISEARIFGRWRRGGNCGSCGVTSSGCGSCGVSVPSGCSSCGVSGGGSNCTTCGVLPAGGALPQTTATTPTGAQAGVPMVPQSTNQTAPQTRASVIPNISGAMTVANPQSDPAQSTGSQHGGSHAAPAMNPGLPVVPAVFPQGRASVVGARPVAAEKSLEEFDEEDEGLFSYERAERTVDEDSYEKSAAKKDKAPEAKPEPEVSSSFTAYYDGGSAKCSFTPVGKKKDSMDDKMCQVALASSSDCLLEKIEKFSFDGLGDFSADQVTVKKERDILNRGDKLSKNRALLEVTVACDKMADERIAKLGEEGEDGLFKVGSDMLLTTKDGILSAKFERYDYNTGFPCMSIGSAKLSAEAQGAGVMLQGKQGQAMVGVVHPRGNGSLLCFDPGFLGWAKKQLGSAYDLKNASIGELVKASDKPAPQKSSSGTTSTSSRSPASSETTGSKGTKTSTGSEDTVSSPSVKAETEAEVARKHADLLKWFQASTGKFGNSRSNNEVCTDPETCGVNVPVSDETSAAAPAMNPGPAATSPAAVPAARTTPAINPNPVIAGMTPQTRQSGKSKVVNSLNWTWTQVSSAIASDTNPVSLLMLTRLNGQCPNCIQSERTIASWMGNGNNSGVSLYKVDIDQAHASGEVTRNPDGTFQFGNIRFPASANLPIVGVFPNGTYQQGRGSMGTPVSDEFLSRVRSEFVQ